MKFIRVIKSSLNKDLLNTSNWTSIPHLTKEGHIYKLTGRYRTDIISKIPGDSNEDRLWTEDYSKLGNWSEETTRKYKEEAISKGIIKPIMIHITNNKVTCWEGNHRKKIAEYLKLKDVPVVVFSWDTELPTEDYFGLLSKIKEFK